MTTTTMLASWLYARPPDRPPSMVAATPRRRNYRNPRDIINAPFGTRGKYPLGSLRRRRRYRITPAAGGALHAQARKRRADVSPLLNNYCRENHPLVLSAALLRQDYRL